MINADPDAIASAMAVKRLLWRKTARVAITSITTIKRPDNLAMVESLGAKLTKSAELSKNGFTKFVIVDSQPEHNDLFQKYTYDVIIDHHPSGAAQAKFADIRPEYGATSTILVEYLRAAGIKPSMKLATALFLGIKTDTDGFTRNAIDADVKAFRYVFKYINIYLVHRIEHAEIRPSYLRFFQKAIGERVTIRGRVFVHLGVVGSSDVCVMIADFLMRISNVRWSIVSGIFGKTIVVIFRSDGIRKNCGKLASDAFGAIGSAGGHKAMARAEIPASAVSESVDIENEKKVGRWIIRRIITDSE
jgi:nanoRNase/pAp phosphatase (c-di-AMP/oligoRNAs hydrolase)